MGLASREGRGCRAGGLCCPVSLQAEENRIKLLQVTECGWSPCSVHLPVGFGARAIPGGREGTWQRRQHTSPSRAREKILLWGCFPDRPVCLPCNSPVRGDLRGVGVCPGCAAAGQPPGRVSSPRLSLASGDGGSHGARVQLCPCRSAQALGCPLLQTGQRVCAAACQGGSCSGVGTPFASSSPVCCGEPAQAPCSCFLGSGSCSASEAAGSRNGMLSLCRGASQAPVDTALPAGCWAEPLCLPCTDKYL